MDHGAILGATRISIIEEADLLLAGVVGAGRIRIRDHRRSEVVDRVIRVLVGEGDTMVVVPQVPRLARGITRCLRVLAVLVRKMKIGGH